MMQVEEGGDEDEERNKIDEVSEGAGIDRVLQRHDELGRGERGREEWGEAKF